LWAGRSLGKSLTPFPEPISGAQLVAQGPYRLVRHPIYGGIIVALAGLALFQGSTMTLIGAVEMGALFWLKSSFEERRLLIAHPMYRQYQQSVPKRLIPFLV
jgi:protein-S-isoprenylcysteine O-methyltransferase Ste14